MKYTTIDGKPHVGDDKQIILEAGGYIEVSHYKVGWKAYLLHFILWFWWEVISQGRG